LNVVFNRNEPFAITLAVAVRDADGNVPRLADFPLTKGPFRQASRKSLDKRESQSAPSLPMVSLRGAASNSRILVISSRVSNNAHKMHFCEYQAICGVLAPHTWPNAMNSSFSNTFLNFDSQR
jgi:hypothetical protein